MENGQERKWGGGYRDLLGSSNGVGKASGVKVGERCVRQKDQEMDKSDRDRGVGEWGYSEKA